MLDVSNHFKKYLGFWLILYQSNEHSEKTEKKRDSENFILNKSEF